MKWQRIPIETSDTGEVVESTGLCVMTDNVYIAIGPLLGIMIALLIGGNYLSYKARNIPSEYAESKWVGFSMILYLEALVLGVPVVILSSGNAGASFVVKSVAIVLADFGTVALIFLPKIWLMYGWGIDGQSSLNKEDSTDNHSGSKSSKQGGRKTNSRENVTSTYPGSRPDHASPQTAALSNQDLAPSSKMSSNVLTLSSSELHKASAMVKKQSQKLTSIPANNITIEVFDKIYPSIEQALEDEQARNGLIAYSGPQFFDEPIRFYSDVVDFQHTKYAELRVKKSMAIIKRYILVNAPLELSLPSPLKSKYERILARYEEELSSKKSGPSFLKFFSFGSSAATAPEQSDTESPSLREVSSNSVRADVHAITNSPGPRPISSSFRNDPSPTPTSAFDQLKDPELFRPVQNLVCYEIQADRKRWKAVIHIIDPTSQEGTNTSAEGVAKSAD